MALSITSPAFVHNSTIPIKYSGLGEDINPPLTIVGVPPAAKSLVMILDDPDAPVGTWDHWIVYDFVPSTTQIDGNSLPKDAVQGKNSWGDNRYGGPCPPSGTHRYFFKLYALDTKLGLEEGATKGEVESAMKGHILEKTELMGLFSK